MHQFIDIEACEDRFGLEETEDEDEDGTGRVLVSTESNQF